MGKPARWSKAVYEYLAEHQDWQKLDEVVAHAMPFVPSERGWRAGKTYMDGNKRRYTKTRYPDAPEISDEELIYRGRMEVVKASISQGVRLTRILQSTDALGVRWLKMNACPTCGRVYEENYAHTSLVEEETADGKEEEDG